MARVTGTIKTTSRKPNAGRVFLSAEEKKKYEDLATRLNTQHQQYGQHLAADNRRR